MELANRHFEAGGGFEPLTSGLWVMLLNPCRLCVGFCKSAKPTNAGSHLPGTQQ